MIRRALPVVAGLLGGTALVASQPAEAQQVRTAFLDVDAGLGYSTNPLLDFGNDTGSAFGRISARGVYAWRGERSATSLTGYVENSAYFRRYGNKQIFSVDGHTDYAVSEALRIFADAGFAGDFGGQLSSRFAAIPTTPLAADPTVPPVLTVVDPRLVSLLGRQYRLSGQVGASMRVNPRDFLTVAAGAQRNYFTGASRLNGYNVYSGSGSYERQLSPRTAIGARVLVQRADFDQGGTSTSIAPQVFGRTQISEVWNASGAIGVNFTKQDSPTRGHWTSASLSLDGSLCRESENYSVCVRASRKSQDAATAELLSTTSASIDYRRRFSARDDLQLSLGASRYAGLDTVIGSSSTTSLTASAAYNRKLSDRFSGGVNLLARQIRQTGIDPNADLGGSVFVRYRLGNLK